ncbi:ATP phosphoribosyltransferase regulatory subunit [Thermovenabulum sp.]|uniref:ATP phosphoribosyltransferase regulatory subunit n=1 Tax=Thermovenabulum sp. TaxID=3100335 RepID=UPI003C7C84F8
MGKKFTDYCPPGSIFLEKVREKIGKLYGSFGYEPVEPSVFLDYEDLYYKDKNNSFKVVDYDGRVLTLRTEYTLSAAEMAARINDEGRDFIKFYYFGKVFRYITENAGDYREFHQIGIENIMGKDDPFADIEVIALAVETLLELGFKSFTVDVGEVNFFKGITFDYGFDEESSEILCKLIDKKDYIGIENFLSDKNIKNSVIDDFRKITRLYGKGEVLKKAKEYARNEISKKSLERLNFIYERLISMGYEDYISLDLGMLKHMDYYTGIIFTGYIEGLGYPVLSGGRYDSLFLKFNRNLYAVGFAAGLERILEKAGGFKEGYKVYIGYDEEGFKKAFNFTRFINDKTYFQSFPEKPEDSLKRAKKLGAEKIYYFKGDEIIFL